MITMGKQKSVAIPVAEVAPRAAVSKSGDAAPAQPVAGECYAPGAITAFLSTATNLGEALPIAHPPATRARGGDKGSDDDDDSGGSDDDDGENEDERLLLLRIRIALIHLRCEQRFSASYGLA